MRARAPTLFPVGGLVNQAEQTAASAVTGREHVQQAGHVPGRAERAVRRRDYFALQEDVSQVLMCYSPRVSL